jgi:hypothetical protein
MIRKVSMIGLGFLLAACEFHASTGGAQSPSNPPPASPAPGAPQAAPGAAAAPNTTPGQAPRVITPIAGAGRVAAGLARTGGGAGGAGGGGALGGGTLGGGGASGGGSGAAPVINKPIDFGSGEAKPGSLTGTVYFIPEKVEKFPDVSKLPAAATLYTTELNIAPRRFDAGFPGVNDRNEWFAIRYEGPLEVTTEADYEFRVVSDDGALFYIDGTLIIDNDGVHPPSEKKQIVHLVKGAHSMRVDYFQGPRYEVALQLFVKSPGAAERLATTKL